MTYEEHLKAVRKNGHKLMNVPERYRTSELCLAAMQSENYALAYLPKQHRTLELCLAAVRPNGYMIPFAFQYIPDRHKEACEAYYKLIGEQR